MAGLKMILPFSEILICNSIAVGKALKTVVSVVKGERFLVELDTKYEFIRVNKCVTYSLKLVQLQIELDQTVKLNDYPPLPPSTPTLVTLILNVDYKEIILHNYYNNSRKYHSCHI